MAVVPLNSHLPDALGRAGQALAPHSGDATTLIRRAVEEYVTATAKRTGRRTNKHRQLVQALSTPVSALRVSARPPTALWILNVMYPYALAQKAPSTSSGCGTRVEIPQ
ncbi:MAG: hypothetical protein EHM71_15330, partial [Zetaproteobacteria bacterium]